MLDIRLLEFLGQEFSIQNIENVKSVHLFKNGSTIAFDIDHEGCCKTIPEKYLA